MSSMDLPPPRTGHIIDETSRIRKETAREVQATVPITRTAVEATLLVIEADTREVTRMATREATLTATEAIPRPSAGIAATSAEAAAEAATAAVNIAIWVTPRSIREVTNLATVPHTRVRTGGIARKIAEGVHKSIDPPHAVHPEVYSSISDATLGSTRVATRALTDEAVYKAHYQGLLQ